MDHVSDPNDRSLNAANEYPDLDYTPNYPWIGSLDGSNILTQYSSQNSSHESSLRVVETQPQGLLNEDEQNDKAHRVTTVSKDVCPESNSPWRAIGDPNDTLNDPDFALPEEDYTSDELVSELDSESTYESSQDYRDRQKRINKGRRKKRRMNRAQNTQCERRGRGIRRGQRKALEPSIEFKALHSQATMAFIDHDYEEAEQLALQAILVNPEIFPAYSLLSEIHMARGSNEKALAALFNGAHTRPRDTQVWSKVAQLITERAGEDKLSVARDAMYCYSRVLTVDKTDVRARFRRAALNRDLGYDSKAANDYEYLLKLFPHDTAILRLLAETCIDMDDAGRAIYHYLHSLSHYQTNESEKVTSVSWSDVNIYAELYGIQQEYDKGIRHIKSLSRWLLGRSSDILWEAITVDDREWDSEDEPRRNQLEGFIPGRYESSAYGDGLPLELRVKLGIYRLNLGDQNLKEAINHFEWLDPKDLETGAKVFDYPDLFREVAAAFYANKLYNEALKFYEPLQQVSDYTDTSYFTDMAFCYRAIGQSAEARECYQTIIQSDEASVEARLQALRTCEELSMLDGLEINREEISAFNETAKPRRPRRIGASKKIGATHGSSSSAIVMIAPRLARRPGSDIVLERTIRDKAKADETYTLFLRMISMRKVVQDGDQAQKSQWMLAAKTLIQDFQSERLFFPLEKYVRFYGYSKEARRKSLNTKAVQAQQEADTTNKRLNLSSEYSDTFNESVPSEFRGVQFHVWLDIFLEYSMTLAQSGDKKSAYEVLASASSANVFYHFPNFMFLIHVCWFTCALVANDEETLCNVARWFMKEYQFVTDGYRLFSALNRLCDSANSRYNCGPTQKHILRQVKAMDFSLVTGSGNRSIFQERASYTTKDRAGNWIQANDLDIALLMLYGHILYVGKSYSYSINYFFRAFALDPANPMINISLALGYLHYAIKRQADNRHHFAMQGFAFLFTYYDIRQDSNTVLLRQEAEYNVARAYHMLGLTHLAIPYYLQCLVMDEDLERLSFTAPAENFTRDAAFALQVLLTASGDVDKAREVTERWLVV